MNQREVLGNSTRKQIPNKINKNFLAKGNFHIYRKSLSWLLIKGQILKLIEGNKYNIMLSTEDKLDTKA